MPWVDVVPQLLDEGLMVLGLAGYQSSNGASSALLEPDAQTVLFAYCGAEHVIHSPAGSSTPAGALENGAFRMFFNPQGGPPSWSAFFVSLYPITQASQLALVGRRFRVRALISPWGDGEDVPAEPVVWPQLRMGILRADASGGGIVAWYEFNYLAQLPWTDYGWSTWSDWIETPTITDVMMPPDVGTFAGLGVVMGGSDSPQSGIVQQMGFEWQVWVESVDPPEPVDDCSINTNCECDDSFPRVTLAAMRRRLAIRLGFGAQVDNLPPGVALILDDFIRSAQEQLFTDTATAAMFNIERFYTWQLQPGVRFYDLDANIDDCPRRLDPRQVTWVGVSACCHDWKELGCGIPPELYDCSTSHEPDRYEIRQCIEVWPPPADSTRYLRVKGKFGLAPLLVDADETTIDPEAIFLHALAHAKADRGAPDAANYMGALRRRLGDLNARSHHTRSYLPGSRPAPRTPYRVGRTGREL